MPSPRALELGINHLVSRDRTLLRHRFEHVLARTGDSPRHDAEAGGERVADEDGKGNRAEARAPAECDPDRKREDLDRRTDGRDPDSRPPVDAGHPPVSGAGAEIGGEVQGASEPDRGDADADLEKLPGESAWLRQHTRGDIEREADEDDVADRPDPRRLPQWDP